MSGNTSVARFRATLAALLAGAVAAVAPAAAARAPTETWLAVSRFDVRYAQAMPGLPETDTLARLELALGRTERGYVAPGSGAPDVMRTLEGIAGEPTTDFAPDALTAITEQLTAHFTDELLGDLITATPVLVVVDGDDVDPAHGRDLRPPGRTALRLVIAVDGPVVPVSRFALEFIPAAHPDQPSIDEMLQVTVDLARTDTGLAAWRPGADTVRLRLADFDGVATHALHVSAIQKILEALRDALGARGLVGIFAGLRPGQFDDASGADLRAADTALTIELFTGFVTDVRTLASGDRIPSEERVNHPAHRRIRERSPLRPFVEGDTDRRDLLWKKPLDDYLFRQSRFPGRNVDAALSRGDVPGGATLDYLIAESKPLLVYAQLSNTGTEQTERLREGVGLIHHQLTNHDDILAIDYTTAGFDQTNAVVASYEAMVGDYDRLRWRAHGNWSEYAASDVGFAGETFGGKSWSAGGDLVFNMLQDGPLFVDLVAGARFEHIEVANPAVFTFGEEDFALPHVGVRLDRITDTASLQASLDIEWSMPDMTAVDGDELNALGRLFPDRRWVVFRWGLSHSFYLEPLLNPDGWADPTTARSSTTAHELAVTFRGQYAFDKRLVPQAEGTAGGFFSVRGYPEAAEAGDTLLIGSLEYRYHVPRGFKVQPEPSRMPLTGQPFHWAPPHAYGRPDWDLILRGFVDVGRTINSERLDFERDETLLGAGVGVELVFRHLNVRVDWGFVLDELESGDADAGSNRLHVLGTIYF